MRVGGAFAAVNALLYAVAFATDPAPGWMVVVVAVINLPAIPCLFGCVALFPPSHGETNAWDYFMVAMAMAMGSAFWGAVAAFVTYRRTPRAKP